MSDYLLPIGLGLAAIGGLVLIAYVAIMAFVR